jgi:hypothetical protein
MQRMRLIEALKFNSLLAPFTQQLSGDSRSVFSWNLDVKFYYVRMSKPVLILYIKREKLVHVTGYP